MLRNLGRPSGSCHGVRPTPDTNAPSRPARARAPIIPSKEHHVPPLTRRIARAALLVAAGAAAPAVAAGAANAASLPQATDLGAVSSLDGSNVGNTVDQGARAATSMAGTTGAHVVGTAIPTAGKTVGSTGKTVAPAAQKVAGDTAGSTGTVLGDTAKDNQLPGLPFGG